MDPWDPMGLWSYWSLFLGHNVGLLIENLGLFLTGTLELMYYNMVVLDNIYIYMYLYI